ncbi:hypothetical protein [Sphingobium sp. CAP-1]|uniref:hypothetical protein n=1 Tax=Sphingobium sp. CAP-1 TaxID=2676077 RepID=UPI0012BB2CE6|nr:hypothetical protein [Sphingobium sp. CAP-1]QGP79404.1 hypothetical protein GL174_10730 [Sphingobium sp. CAP-1]
MADRVSASITIGGTLPSVLLPEFIALIENEGLSTEWDGDVFTGSELPENAALDLMAHEVAWGRFEQLEAFCMTNALPFSRWSGAYPGQWGAERLVFTGSGDPVSYAADEDDYILIGRCTAERLGSFAAIVAHFDAADCVVPPLVIG